MESLLFWLDITGKFLLVVVVALTPVWFILLAAWLAKRDLFFTIVKEGEAKSITASGGFLKAVMTYDGYAFRTQVVDPIYDGVGRVTYPFTKGEISWAKEEVASQTSVDKDSVDDNKAFEWLLNKNGEPDKWDVIRLSEEVRLKRGQMVHLAKLPLIGKLVGGIRFMGLFPIVVHAVHKFRFAWASLEFEKDADGKPTDKSVIVPKEEKEMDHVFVKRDVYAIKVTNAPTKEAIPIDMVFLLTIAIRNPYKAMFRIEHWFESLSNKIRTKGRELIGRHSFEELYGKDSQVGREAFSFVLFEQLADVWKDYRTRFGAEVDPPFEIDSVVPTNPEDQKLTIAVYKADVEAKALERTAEAQKRQAELVLDRIEHYGGKEAVEAWLLAGKESKLTHIVQRGAVSLPALSSVPATTPS